MRKNEWLLLFSIVSFSGVGFLFGFGYGQKAGLARGFGAGRQVGLEDALGRPTAVSRIGRDEQLTAESCFGSEVDSWFCSRCIMRDQSGGYRFFSFSGAVPVKAGDSIVVKRGGGIQALLNGEPVDLY